jgi:hypothetical protein
MRGERDVCADAFAACLCAACPLCCSLMLRGVATEAAKPPSQLPPPINAEAAQEDWPTFYAQDLALKSIVQDSSGFEFVDEGSSQCAACHKYGFRTSTVGSFLTLKVSSAVLSEADLKAQGKAEGEQTGPKVMLALSYLRSYSDVARRGWSVCRAAAVSPRFLTRRMRRGRLSCTRNAWRSRLRPSVC